MSLEQDMVDAYIAAERAVLAGKTYRMGQRELAQEDLSEIRKGRREWEQRLAAPSGGFSRHATVELD